MLSARTPAFGLIQLLAVVCLYVVRKVCKSQQFILNVGREMASRLLQVINQQAPCVDAMARGKPLVEFRSLTSAVLADGFHDEVQNMLSYAWKTRLRVNLGRSGRNS